MRIQHKNMRDVAAEVLAELPSEEGRRVFRICWVNLLGTYDNPSPFPMGSHSRLAVEIIKIPADKFESEWRIINGSDL